MARCFLQLPVFLFDKYMAGICLQAQEKGLKYLQTNKKENEKQTNASPCKSDVVRSEQNVLIFLQESKDKGCEVLFLTLQRCDEGQMGERGLGM